MPKRNLIGNTLRHSVYLRKLIDSIFFFECLIVFSFFGLPRNALGFVIVFINLNYIKVKADNEFGVGPCTRKKIAGNFGLINFEYFCKTYNLSLRRGHLSGHTL